MLMFQQKRLRLRAGSSRRAARSMWLIGSGGSPSCGAASQSSSISSAIVQVQEPGPGLGQVAAHGRQQRHRPHHVAAGGLALQALTDPEQRRPATVDRGRPLDQLRRHSGDRLRPLRRARFELRLQLVPPDRVALEQLPVGQPVAHDHVQHRERQGGVAAGERLQVQVGLLRRRRADRVDHDHRARGLGKPVIVGVGRRGRRVRAPHHDAPRISCAARIEAGHGAAVHVVERDVAGLVADRVGIDLGCTQPAEEPRAERKAITEQVPV